MDELRSVGGGPPLGIVIKCKPARGLTAHDVRENLLAARQQQELGGVHPGVPGGSEYAAREARWKRFDGAAIPKSTNPTRGEHDANLRMGLEQRCKQRCMLEKYKVSWRVEEDAARPIAAHIVVVEHPVEV